MALSNNPFYLLKVSCEAGRREIVSASDEMSLFLDSETCLKAQNELINLNKRLSAEINWFIDSDADTIESIRSSIEKAEPISTDGLPKLSKLNATLHNFSLSSEEAPFEVGYSILDIDEQYSAIDAYEITDLINQKRNEAKFAVVNSQDVVTELGKKREEIRQIVTEKLYTFNKDTYIELITMLAEKCIADEEYDDGVVLSDVIDQYEIRMQSVLEESTDKIEEHIESIKNLTNDGFVSESVNSLICSVEQWDVIAQPLQLKSQASGMPHDISEQLGSELRNLALYLHNEKSLTKEALTLVNAMKSVFAELALLADSFDSDSEVLNDLLKGQKEAEEIAVEFKFLQNESENILNNPSLTIINNYVERVVILDCRIKNIDLDDETKSKIRENLCCMARGTAIELHNKNNQTSFALKISKALVDEFGDMPALHMKLSSDVTTLDQQLIFSHLNQINLPSSKKRNRSSFSGNEGCFLGALAVAGVIVLIILVTSLIGNCSSSSNSKHSTYYSQTDTESYASSYTVTLDRSGGTGGSTSVIVRKDDDMPYASAPSKKEYVFKGYYSSSNGGGTQYYDENMKSVHNWTSSEGGILYAYWVVDTSEKTDSNNTITLSTSNFELYFNITTDAEFVNDDVTIKYKISPKEKSYSKNADSSDKIEVEIGAMVSMFQQYYGTPKYNKTHSVTLKKSHNYKASGSFTFTYSCYTDKVYWMTDVTSCSGELGR